MSEVKSIVVKLKDVKLNPDNPRLIKDQEYRDLVQSLKDFPEMTQARELVLNTDMMILGGNKRYRAMQEASWKQAPAKVVDWPAEKQREFVIKDNLHKGEWDWGMLANEWSESELNAWGLDTGTSDKIDKAQEGDKIKVPQSVQIEPPKEYVMIVADPNSDDWDEIKRLLELQMVKRGGYKKDSPFNSTGLERVFTWSEFKKRAGL